MACLHVLQDLGHTSDFSCRRTVSHLHHALGKSPRPILARDRVLYGGRNSRLDTQPAEAILADGLCVAKAAETFLACEAAVARAGDAAKGELDGVVSSEVVDGDHARLEAADDGLQGWVALRAVDRGAKAKVGGICDGENVLCAGGLCAQHGEDGSEAFVLGDAHGGRDVDEERGLEVVAFGMVRMDVAFAAGEEAGALRDGFGNELFEAGKGGVRDHGAHVCVGAEADGLDAGLEHFNEAVVRGAGRDDALDADAVLAGGLKGAPEDDVADAGEVAVFPAAGGLEHDEGVLAAELGDDGRKALGGAGGDVVGDGLRADEGDVADARVRRQVARSLWPASHHLDELRIVAVGSKGAARNLEKVLARPGRLLRNLDHDTIAAEDGADDGAHQVVEGIVPADQRGHHAERLVMHRVALIRHEQVGRSARWPQGLFAVRERPLDLLNGDEDLAQLGVHHGLAAIQTGNPADLLGVIHNVHHERAQDCLALRKGRRASPFPLRFCRGGNGTIDAVFSSGFDGAEELSRGGRVALNS